MHSTIAIPLYEQNRLEEAETHLLQCIEWLELCRMPLVFLLRARRMLALVYQAQGNATAARTALRWITARLPGAESYVIDEFDRSLVKVRACLAHSDPSSPHLSELAAWVRVTCQREAKGAQLSPGEQRELARGLLALGEPQAAARRLESLPARVRKEGFRGLEIPLLAMQAVAEYAAGNSTKAATILSRALLLGEPEVFVRAFVDCGQPMAELLQTPRLVRMAVESGVSPQYVARLVSAFPTATTTWRSAQDGKDSPVLVEPLSEREIDVLRLVASGRRNREIAQQLFLSTNTVAWHLKNVYGKLGARNRVEAAALARELRVL
jgi:LuxR family maltose regulon positive regulatory protein